MVVVAVVIVVVVVVLVVAVVDVAAIIVAAVVVFVDHGVYFKMLRSSFKNLLTTHPFPSKLSIFSIISSSALLDSCS